MENVIQKAEVFLEALPYIMRFRDKIFVIKFGGAAMVEENLKASFAEDILLLHYIGIHPVVVHGGGPQISKQLERSGVKSSFVNGMRVTDEATMQVVEQVLVGQINKEIVSLISKHGGNAVGISGKDGPLLQAKKIVSKAGLDGSPAVDLGFVGEVARVDPRIIQSLVRDRFIPVIAPVAADESGGTYNINADPVAGAIASALKAEKFILMTDVQGVKDKAGALYSVLTAREAERRMEDATIAGGMIPKVQCCVDALRAGVSKAHIIDGRVPHAILLEIFTDKGIGTEIHLAGRSARAPEQRSLPSLAGKSAP